MSIWAFSLAVDVVGALTGVDNVAGNVVDTVVDVVVDNVGDVDVGDDVVDDVEDDVVDDVEDDVVDDVEDDVVDNVVDDFVDVVVADEVTSIDCVGEVCWSLGEGLRFRFSSVSTKKGEQAGIHRWLGMHV